MAVSTKVFLSIALCVLLVIAPTAVTADTRVVELTPQNVNDYIGKDNLNVFVLFCVKWSRDCKNLYALWDRLSVEMAKKSIADVFVAARIDGDKYPELARRFNVKSYPSSIYYTQLYPEGIPYDAIREISLLRSFVFQYT